jgi:hypothetical protein
VCAVTTDVRADNDDRGHHRLVLKFGAQQFQGGVQSVTQTATAVGNSLQYRVNVVAIGPDRKQLQCILFVGSMADAQLYKNLVLDERTESMTCSVSHALTSDATSGTFVVINTGSPNAGDSVAIDSR